MKNAIVNHLIYPIPNPDYPFCYHFIPDKCYDPLAGLIQIGLGGLFELSHAFLWNRGMLIMPYFKMLMLAPDHAKEDTDKFLKVWDEIVAITMGA